MQTTPFTIRVPQTTLDDLRERLARTRLPDAPEDAGWSMGTDLGFMKKLVEHWTSRYDFRKHEAALNELPQFTAEVESVKLHFVHARGKGPKPAPLLLLHGWPDSFYRYHKVVDRLADPEKHGGAASEAFDVVVPSLPGFGFSERRAMDAASMAKLVLALMKGLGYSRFFVAGGDLGATVAMELARIAPDALAGMHLGDVGYPDGNTDFATLSPPELEFAQFIQGWWMREGAFNMVQATKPQSLAFALHDSPAGLAAWILSVMASNASDKTEERFTLDEILTNITLYWVTETIGSSMRVYLENARSMYSEPPVKRPKSAVETAVIHMPLDAPLPREWAERNVNLVRFTEMPRGGHFAPWEIPEEYAADLRAFAADRS
jgi:pimeloyl-ACP methyl ester carboxylesterase